MDVVEDNIMTLRIVSRKVNLLLLVINLEYLFKLGQNLFQWQFKAFDLLWFNLLYKQLFEQCMFVESFYVCEDF